MTNTTPKFLTTECPNGHRVRGDLGWLNRAVHCPHCHAEFVFAPSESHAAEVVTTQEFAARRSEQSGGATQKQEKWSPSDTGVMRVLGDYVPPPKASENAMRRCPGCGAVYSVEDSRCYSCNLELGPVIVANEVNETLPIDFREVGKLAFEDVNVRRVMRPRREILFLDVNDSLAQIQKQVRETMHSRYPVCDRSLDKILGVVHIKDILVAESDDLDIRTLLKTPEEIRDTSPVSKVLHHFQSDDVPLTFVVDEYGTIIGMVTLKDVLSKLVKSSVSVAADNRLNKLANGQQPGQPQSDT